VFFFDVRLPGVIEHLRGSTQKVRAAFRHPPLAVHLFPLFLCGYNFLAEVLSILCHFFLVAQLSPDRQPYNRQDLCVFFIKFGNNLAVFLGPG
jgi:hypothetical protein